MEENDQEHSPRPLGIEQAAAFLGLSQSYLYRLTSERRIPHYKSRGGKRVYFDPEDLKAWAYGRRVEVDGLSGPAKQIDQHAADYVTLRPLR